MMALLYEFIITILSFLFRSNVAYGLRPFIPLSEGYFSFNFQRLCNHNHCSGWAKIMRSKA